MDDPASSRDQRNQLVSSGDRPPVMPDNGVFVQQISPGPSLYNNVLQNPTNLYPYDWNAAHSGYAQSINTWDGYATSPEALHLPQAAYYNEDSSFMYQPGFTFNTYPSMMLDGQIPISPAYYPQFGAPSAAMHFTHSEIGGDNLCYDPTSAYMIPFGGGYGGGNLYGNQGANSLLTYPQTMGILGPYDPNASQLQLHGNGIPSISSLGGYYPVGSYQRPSSIASYYGPDNPVRLASGIGKLREKEYSSSLPTTGDLYRNRGPRSSSRVKSKNNGSRVSSSAVDSNTAGPNPSNLYNLPDFVTDYKKARFFIVKSFSEDNVHRSIKYNVWASTPHGNKKLDTAYRDAEKMGVKCPIILFFSVNGSGQFCGVAEMVGPVDFEKDAAYWQQGRWSGQFPVKWRVVKDVPNNRFSHILLQNNDDKPVTHSRDSQEVKIRQGIEMLRIFKEYEARTSVLDDFDYYDEREIQKVGKDGERREETSYVEQLSERLQAVTVEDGKEGEREDLKDKELM